MPLYLDVHAIAAGVSAEDVAGAHMADVQAQGGYDVRYLSYRGSEQPGKGVRPSGGAVRGCGSGSAPPGPWPGRR
jgi:hypothetical protein